MLEQYLHSTMVRLKFCRNVVDSLRELDLHSTMVRLKFKSISIGSIPVSLFTFHYG